jgi:hypothetical protein
MGAIVSLAGLIVPTGPARAAGCGVDSLAYTVSDGGSVENKYGTWTKDRLEVNSYLYKATGGSVTFTYRNTTYTVSKGAFFKPSCFTTHGDGPYPSIWLYRGRADVKGTQDSPASEGVVTPEAVLHTTRSAYTKYSVTRRVKDGDPNKGIVTLLVTDGAALTMSPNVGLAGDAGCTEGQKLTINWKGEITQG